MNITPLEKTETVTCDTIINFLADSVKTRKPLSPHLWLESALQLNILLGDENHKKTLLEMECAQLKAAFISNGDSVAKAEAKLEATETYRDYRLMKARIEQIQEHIRLAKKTAQITSDELRSGL